MLSRLRLSLRPLPLVFNAQHRLLKVYTRTGDKGSSSLFNGERKPKDDQRFQTLGAVDELNASVGFAREFVRDKQFGTLPLRLEEIQHRLFDVGAHVATPPSSTEEKKARTSFPPNMAVQLEGWIDEYETVLPPLKNFIHPSGGKASAALHISRTICRRAERELISLSHNAPIDMEVERFMNRLSDYLFMAARVAAFIEKEEETVYKREEPPTPPN